MIQTTAGPEKLTFASFKERKKRRETTFVIHPDDDLVKAFELADQSLNRAKLLGNKSQIAQAQRDVAAAEEALRKAALILRLRALPRDGEHSFKVLIAEHPPTKKDQEEIAERSDDPTAKARWHGDTFGPALVAACLVEPEVTVDQATEWASDWNDGEWFGLFSAAISVNESATNTAGLVFS